MVLLDFIFHQGLRWLCKHRVSFVCFRLYLIVRIHTFVYIQLCFSIKLAISCDKPLFLPTREKHTTSKTPSYMYEHYY